ncbi:MAG: ABC transporter ATP-binding protein [Syntrophaceticus schinkii]|jgi:iron complex transport system ATP-binding protein
MKLVIDDLVFSYTSTPVLDNVTFEFTPQETLAIVGPNGAGKSTLLKCIDGLLKFQKGSISLDGKDIKSMSRLEIAKHIGYVPQTSEHIFPFTVFDMVLLGRRSHLSWRNSKEDILNALKMLQLLNIEDLAMKNFNEVSGGQQQKVIIARALAQEAEVLLLDEPTSNLDILHQLEVMELIKSLVIDIGIAAIISVHDLNLASRYSDKVIMLKEGKIIAAGNPFSVFTPENIGSVYGVEVAVKNEMGRPYIVPLGPLRAQMHSCRSMSMGSASFQEFRT